jgi:hypothetical protein
MQANTKQVRKVVRNAISFVNAYCSNTYTEKTSKLQQKRRSVVFPVYNSASAKLVLPVIKAEFAKLGYTNKVTLTSGIYLRVIADIA